MLIYVYEPIICGYFFPNMYTYKILKTFCLLCTVRALEFWTSYVSRFPFAGRVPSWNGAKLISDRALEWKSVGARNLLR
jgi:hypothetical protein